MSDFVWESPEGVKITLPRLGSVKGGVLRKYRHLDDLDFLFSIVEEIADEDELAKIDDLASDDMNAMFAKWQRAAKVSVPQS